MTDILFGSAANPLPEEANAGFFKARDGRRIRYALFGATGRPLRGTVILLQGRNECIEKYFETVRDLAASGFGVATFDLRGQGGSERLLRNPLPGHVRRFDDYVSDLERFFDEMVLPDCRGPYSILGHSTGSLVALLAAPLFLNRVRRMVLVAPLLEIHGLPVATPTARRLTGLMRLVGGGGLPLSRSGRDAGGFAGNVLTSDPARFARNAAISAEHPELALGPPTAGWVHAACRAMDRVKEPGFLASIRVPILFVAAGADTVVSTRAIEDYARHLRCGSVLTIDGARHEILQEADLYREQLLAAFKAFVSDDVEAEG